MTKTSLIVVGNEKPPFCSYFLLFFFFFSTLGTEILPKIYRCKRSTSPITHDTQYLCIFSSLLYDQVQDTSGRPYSQIVCFMTLVPASEEKNGLNTSFSIYNSTLLLYKTTSVQENNVIFSKGYFCTGQPYFQRRRYKCSLCLFYLVLEPLSPQMA